MRKRVVPALILIVAFVYLNNSSMLVRNSDERPFLLAHRGLAQTFSMDGITAQTNTAERIDPPEHPYLENTIASMEAAFRAGADMVEFDVHRAKDGQLAVFHDADLSYRTNGAGPTKDFTMDELKALDVGYGYTADGGQTHPFRGKGVGLMPSFDEVMSRFPDRPLLIHVQSNDPEDGELLATRLGSMPESRLGQLAVYGGDRPIAVVKQKVPAIRAMSAATTKKALIAYMLVGWTGYVPAPLRNTYLHLPQKYARFLWGWPNRFIQRMNGANTLFLLVAGDGKWSEGFDSAESLDLLPKNYVGGIWTDRIDRIAPIIAGSR